MQMALTSWIVHSKFINQISASARGWECLPTSSPQYPVPLTRDHFLIGIRPTCCRLALLTIWEYTMRAQYPRRDVASSSEIKNEQFGEPEIEAVKAEGIHIITSVRAGAIGNEQPMEISSTVGTPPSYRLPCRLSIQIHASATLLRDPTLAAPSRRF